MKVRPEQLRLYAVTDRAWAADEDAFLAQVQPLLSQASDEKPEIDL